MFIYISLGGKRDNIIYDNWQVSAGIGDLDTANTIHVCVVCKEEKGKKKEENIKMNNQMKTCIGEMECVQERSSMVVES